MLRGPRRSPPGARRRTSQDSKSELKAAGFSCACTCRLKRSSENTPAAAAAASVSKVTQQQGSRCEAARLRGGARTETERDATSGREDRHTRNLIKAARLDLLLLLHTNGEIYSDICRN